MNQKLSNLIQQLSNIPKIYFIVNVLFFLIPIAFLLGNFAINLMILLISSVSFIFFRKKLSDIKSYKIIYYFFAFFVMVIISSLIEFYNNPVESHLIKSVLYLNRNSCDFSLKFLWKLVYKQIQHLPYSF